MRLAVLALPLALAGCITRESYESIPVEVASAQGPVICQLYGINQVVHDRAIERPSTMTEDEANRICRAEGERRLPG